MSDPQSPPTNSSRPGAITFDFSNTLVDCTPWFDLEVYHLPGSWLAWWSRNGGPGFDPALADRANAAYRDLRAEIHEHGNELTTEQSIHDVMGRLSMTVPDDAVMAGAHDLMWETLQHAELVPGAVEAVDGARAFGLPLGIVSSAIHHPFLLWALDRFDLADRFDVVATSASIGFYKSRPEIYTRTLELIGANPADSIHIGDSWRFDVEGAARAGMRTVWFDRPSRRPECPELHPDSVITTMADLPATLGRMMAGTG